MSKDNEDRRIPRPPNAFMLFGQQHRRDIARQFPDLTNKQISKILGNEWRNMRPDDKSFYHRLADEAHADHMKKYPGYYYSPLEARQRKAERKRKYMQRMSVRRPNNENAENMIAIQAIPDESTFGGQNITLTPEELGLIQDQSAVYQLDSSQACTPYMHIDCGNTLNYSSIDGNMSEPMERNLAESVSASWYSDHSYAAMVLSHPASLPTSQPPYYTSANSSATSTVSSASSIPAILMPDNQYSICDPSNINNNHNHNNNNNNNNNTTHNNNHTIGTTITELNQGMSGQSNSTLGQGDEVNFALLLADYLPPMDDPYATMIQKDETLSSLVSKDDDDIGDFFTFACVKNESVNDDSGISSSAGMF